MARYFHGGKPGMVKGMMILPPAITGARCSSDYGAAHVHRRDRVYVVTAAEGALIFAALHQSMRGAVYEVEPLGLLEPDPDYAAAHGLDSVESFQCERARILRVVRYPPTVLEALRTRLLAHLGIEPRRTA
jgi:hypothetical protein